MMRIGLARWVGLLCAAGIGVSARGEAPVKFEEIFSLVKSNIVGVSDADLSKAAAMGLIEKLQGKVELVEAGVANYSFLVHARRPLIGAQIRTARRLASSRALCRGVGAAA